MKMWNWSNAGIDVRRIWMAPLFSTFGYLWRDSQALVRRALRRDRAYVRKWTAYPAILAGKPKWLLYYEKRRFFVYVPVIAAEVDSLEECKALMEHRYKPAVCLYAHGDGSVHEKPMDGDTYTLNVLFSTMLDATKVLSEKWSNDRAADVRPESPDHGAATARGAGEAGAQTGEEARHGEAESSDPSQEQGASEREGCAIEKAARTVPAERS